MLFPYPHLFTMSKGSKLRKDFPFCGVFGDFLEEYANCRSYWYIPKARTLREGSQVVTDIQRSLEIIFEEFLGRIWNQNTQDELLRRLREEHILAPYKEGSKQDRTALTRIHKVLWETLGFVWVEDNNEIIITDAGLELLSPAEEGKDFCPIIEEQIAKWQYPNPSMGHLTDFEGILPHLFLIQVLQQLEYKINRDELDLFVNLAQSQDDLSRIVRYIKHWRDLNESEQTELLDLVKEIPFPEAPGNQVFLFEYEESGLSEKRPTRYNRIHLNSSYQRAFYSYPRYLKEKDGNIICTSKTEVGKLVREKLKDLKISNFKNKPDWFAYYGDPEQQPSWFTYLSLAIEHATSQQEAKELVQEARQKLTSHEEVNEIERKEIEKGIEDFYIEHLYQIEEGLVLVDYGNREGRQYSTPIGLIDLLCRDQNGFYVVIEIKANEAKDSVFGQILRYIGWVHRNLDGGYNKVRGIILAAGFPDKARYSRIGLELLNDNYKEFLNFKKHGFNLQDT